MANQHGPVYPDELIARIKAGCQFFSTKAVARLVNVPHSTVRAICAGRIRLDVEPDREVIAVIGNILKEGA